MENKSTLGQKYSSTRRGPFLTDKLTSDPINDLVLSKKDKQMQTCQYLVDWIIEELKKIQQNPKHDFPEVLQRRLIDSSFPLESELNKRLVIFLDKYDAQRKKI